MDPDIWSSLLPALHWPCTVQTASHTGKGHLEILPDVVDVLQAD